MNSRWMWMVSDEEVLSSICYLDPDLPEGSSISELQKIDVERSQQQLHEYTRRIPEVRSVMHQEIAIRGAPTDVIAAFAETAGIDLIVMGSHGRGAAGKMVPGSVAESVIRSTHCPVLVTGPNCEPHSRPLKSIVLATDLPPTSLRAAQYATSFTRQFGGTLTIVHVLGEHADQGAFPVRSKGFLPGRTSANWRRMTPSSGSMCISRCGRATQLRRSCALRNKARPI